MPHRATSAPALARSRVPRSTPSLTTACPDAAVTGTGASQLADVTLAPNEQLTVVASTSAAYAAIGAYSIERRLRNLEPAITRSVVRPGCSASGESLQAL